MISADAFPRKKGFIGRIGAGGGFCVVWCGPTLIGFKGVVSDSRHDRPDSSTELWLFAHFEVNM